MRKRIDIVARGRLLEMFGEVPRFALVRAPAGFGKTFLLDQLQAELSAKGVPTHRVNLRGMSEEAGLVAAVTALAGERETVLLIDDAEQLSAFPELLRIVAQLASSASGPRIVFAGRGDFGLPLARYRAGGDMLEIGPRELLFDGEEQQIILEKWAERRISARDIDAITGTIAGWPCGFGLQFQCLELAISEEAGPMLQGSWRIATDYFQQEVFGALPADLKHFLGRVCALEELSVEDCDLVLGGADASAMLELAYDVGVPLWPLDPQHRRYAMLPLFRQFLRAGIADAEAAQSGAHAARLFQECGRFRDASVLALGFGDHDLAARLLEQQFKADFAFRDDTELVSLAERLDGRMRDRHPFILLALAQRVIFRFEFQKARQYLDRARALVMELDDEIGEERRTLEMLLLHREMVLALGQHELSQAQDCGDKLLRDLDQVPPMQRMMILNSLTYAQQELYIFRGAERYYAQAKKLLPELESWVSSIPLETFYARHLFQTGRTTAAIDLLEETLARLVEELGPRPELGSIAGITLAEMKFELNELAEAAQLLADYGGNIEHFGFLPMAVSGRIVQARVHMAQGEYEKGFAVLERPLVAAGEVFDKMFRSLVTERIYWLLRLGRIEAAKLACNTIGLSLTRPPEPHSSAAAAEEAFATTWIQLARANKRIDEAIHLAQKWQRYTEGVGAIRSNVRWNVILASLQMIAEEPSLAMRHLRRAVLLGAGAHYRGAFLAEVDVLHEHYARLVESDLSDVERTFLSSILDDRPASAATRDHFDIALPLGTFSSREAAILRLVAKGMLNREIGSALGMTEGTVKWYLQRIYDKLGIRRRSQVAMLVSQWHSQGTKEAEALH